MTARGRGGGSADVHWVRRGDLHWMRDATTPQVVRTRTLRTREIVTTRRVWRGNEPVWRLEPQPAAIEDVCATDMEGRQLSLPRLLDLASADALCIVHRGHVIHEEYRNGMQPHDQHLLASQTKSVVGLLAAMLIDEGVLSRDAKASKYVSELAGTGYGDATVDDLLHMRTPVTFAGQRYERQREAQRLQTILGFYPFPTSYRGPSTIREWLCSSRDRGIGPAFRYENGSAEAIGWILEKVTSQSLAGILEERIWTKIGAEEDAAFVLDSEGNEQASGGLITTLRDWVRFGEVLRQMGARGTTQIIPEAVVAGITSETSAAVAGMLAESEFGPANRGVGYHDFFWIENDEFGSYEAHGKHVQRLHVSPAAETVFAQFGSFAGAGIGAGLSMGRLVSEMYTQINRHLIAT